MLDSFLTIPLLWAADAPAPRSGMNDFLTPLMYVVPLWLLFYFIFLRPQQQQARRLKEQLNALKKNDRVLTSAGIYGTIVSIDDAGERVVLRVDDDKGVKLAFSKASVVRVIEPTTEKAAESA